MRTPQLRDVICFCFLLIVCGPAGTFADPQTAHFVTVEKGHLPIILSAPHGGNARLPDVEVRTGKNARLFRTSSDLNTAELTLQLADAIEKKLGKRPYLVIAQFHRKYVDANRSARHAYESPAAKGVYDTYHQALSTARHDVMERWGRGVLLDLHGQSAKPDAIFRGTQNGKTTSHLTERFGTESLLGETSLFGQLAKQEFDVIPSVDSTDREHPNYDGGYIVRTYGSQSAGTVDAIQIELGRKLRSNRGLPSTAAKMADAIAAFAEQYLPRTERHSLYPTGDPSQVTIRVGVYSDVGAGGSVKKLLQVLETFDNVSVLKLKADEIRSGACSELDVLIQPGGSGGGQGRHLGEKGREEIRQFVRGGGGFIGICAGAYLASADYSWSLNLLDARVLDRKHWARGRGMVELELTPSGQRLLRSHNKQQLEIYYAQGPLLAPKENPNIDDYEVLARFKTEIAENGAPPGIMKGTTAMARGRYGQGRVFCFSPHPELTEGLERLVFDAIEDVRRKRATIGVKTPRPSKVPE